MLLDPTVNDSKAFVNSFGWGGATGIEINEYLKMNKEMFGNV